jgi:hypothetical protein
MFFRKSDIAKKFFSLAKEIFLNWKDISNELKVDIEGYPTTDVVYAIVSSILGSEHTTFKSADFFNFVHMKAAINEWANQSYLNAVSIEHEGSMLRIANTNQYFPVHYYEKTFVTDDIIMEYERCLGLTK